MRAEGAIEDTLSVGGRVAAVIAIVGVVAVDVGVDLGLNVIGAGASPTPSHEPFMGMIRAGFVLIALAALTRASRASRASSSSSSSSRWRPTIVGASAMLALSLLVDLATTLDLEVLAPLNARLGALDDIERRLFRLAAMASRAVPMIALLAAASDATTTTTAASTTSSTQSSSLSAKAASLLLRFEPTLFAIGATTLPLILAASGLVHRELAWALPIGADTTLAGCIAAAIRLGRSHDRLGRAGFIAIASSMGAGLIMGTWSFGGPLPTPSILGDYVTVTRTVVRDIHIVSLVAGVVAVATSVQRGRP